MKKHLLLTNSILATGLILSTTPTFAQMEDISRTERSFSKDSVKETLKTSAQTRTNSDGISDFLIVIDDPIVGPAIIMDSNTQPTPTPTPTPSPTPTPNPTSIRPNFPGLSPMPTPQAISSFFKPKATPQPTPAAKSQEIVVEHKKTTETSTVNKTTTTHTYEETSYKSTNSSNSPLSIDVSRPRPVSIFNPTPTSTLGRLSSGFNNTTSNLLNKIF